VTDLLAEERHLDARELELELARPMSRCAPTCRTCGIDVEKRGTEYVHILREANGDTVRAHSHIRPFWHGATR
jgi:hypothetical protein